ncbi:radical SAM family heme chaperone HemW [Benzoatithermus flavus]|uniref:Heme chaperone HemW n=1 Tax=Benzoatithermus flavus TaxID=3108223 RepID=A0ABU8XPA9_9PROT
MAGPTEATTPAAAPDGGFALYVHWPFCKAKCPYCDFNSHVRAGVDHARWARALTRELDHVGALTAGRELRSIFFGGGTPSLMEPATVAAVVERATRWWRLAPDIEITLEANPTSVEAGKFRGFRHAGVNRVSLGVQALDDADLRFLGREHDLAQALRALELAGTVFPRHSFDLIYARPGQTLAAWEAELRRALRLAGDHLSLYQLTIEPGTRFHALVREGRLHPLDEDRQGELYEATQAILTEAGLPAYEISNHARPGQESRHNLVYWRYGDYAGIGPGAHGRLTLEGVKLATRTLRMPERWLAQVEARGHGEEPRETVPPVAQLTELLMMGLRLAEGVPTARIAAVTGRPWRESLDAAALERLGALGLLAVEGDRLVATPAGRQRLDAVLRRLL